MTLLEARHLAGLTQDQLANRLGLAGKGSLSRIEQGTERPSLELALKIQLWSDGQVRADELRPDLAHLIAAAAAPAPAA